MSINLNVNEFSGENYYIGYTPLPCKLLQSSSQELRVKLKNKVEDQGGQLVFRKQKSDVAVSELNLVIPANGTPVEFFIAGKYRFASRADKDTVLVVTDAASGMVLFEQAMMVRVRRNANDLSDHERKRFLDALFDFNKSGQYELFCDIHNDDGYGEAHRRYGFLPWHRAFLLDLERQLQIKYPDVTLPYWDFHKPAPKVFTPDFMGQPDSTNGRLKFNDSNPLFKWSVKGIDGLVRLNSFANGTPTLKSLNETLGLSNLFSFANQVGMESNPHNNAHGSFGRGPVTNPVTAPQDPIFYLLHCNVDRLWAVWQALYKRYDINQTTTYPYVGNGSRTSGPFVGDFTKDTLWPWNQDVLPPRPAVRRGSGMPQPVGYPAGSWPESVFQMEQVIDYQGIHTDKPNYFDYEDIYFQ
ncbi:MAG: tyrosinase family protein [Bacteroidota bacterium]